MSLMVKDLICSNLHDKHTAAHDLFKRFFTFCVWDHVCFIFNITLLV